MDGESEPIVSPEYERGKREERIAAHTADQDRHLAAINGNIRDFVQKLEVMDGRLERIEGLLATRTAVDQAIVDAATRSGAARFTKTQIIITVVVAFVAIGGLAVAIATLVVGH